MKRVILLNNPKFVKLNNKLYEINTDFRIALKCNEIAKNEKIGDIERAMAIIYMLFGEEGLNCNEMDKLLELGLKYITIFQKNKNGLKTIFESNFELDFQKCEGLIRSSFKFDYNYDPYELDYLHWYDFYNDLNNLSTSEFGNCCILNRVISILNQDASKIENDKDRQKLYETQEILKEKYCVQKEVKLTKEQEKSVEEFYKALEIT